MPDYYAPAVRTVLVSSSLFLSLTGPEDTGASFFIFHNYLYVCQRKNSFSLYPTVLMLQYCMMSTHQLISVYLYRKVFTAVEKSPPAKYFTNSNPVVGITLKDIV